MLTYRGLLWLPSERPNKQLLEDSGEDFYTQTVDRHCGSCGWIGENLEETEEEGDPLIGPAVSIIIECQDLSDTMDYQPVSMQ